MSCEDALPQDNKGRDAIVTIKCTATAILELTSYE